MESTYLNKILFIVPPNLTFEEFVSPPENVKTVRRGGKAFGAVITDIPLGVLSLSSYVKRFGQVEARLIDFNVEINKLESFDYPSFREFYVHCLAADDVRTFSPDIVALSVLFAPSYRNMLDIAAICRMLFPKALIIAGGGCRPICTARYSPRADASMLFVLVRGRSFSPDWSRQGIGPTI